MNYNFDLQALFSGIETERPVIVAVSGGSDSIALLLMAATWAKTVKADIQVVTVDHGLRPEAAAEAAFVAGVSEALDLMHVTLAWDGIKPVSGISQAARGARYQLLEEFAHDIGAQYVLVGHTANDQAETIIMRNSRGDDSGLGRGLSGMPRTMRLPQGTKLVRPLLGIMREQLRLYLRDMNQGWIEDPSNLDEAYERVRVRNSLQDDEATIKQICRFASVMGRLRKQISLEVSEILTEHLQVEHGPVYTIPFCAFEEREKQIQLFMMQVLVAIAGGAEHFVSSSVLERIFEAELNERMTAGNSVIEKRKNGIRFYREKRNLPSVIIGPGDTLLWDGRVMIENNSSMSYFCGAPSFEQLQEIEQNLDRKINIRPRAVLASTPLLCGDGDDITLPLIKGFQIPAKLNISLRVRAIEHFCSEYDYALLEFVDVLRSKVMHLKSQQH